MQSSPGTTELRVRDVRATIDVATGGRIAQIDVGGRPLLWAGPAAAVGWGSYPMAPWAGRLRDGRFEFEGAGHQLDLNHVDVDGSRHAIHGTVFTAAWTLDDVGSAAVQLHCPLQRDGWPFEGFARQTITVTESSVRCELSVESTDHPFPAAIGWHPWFLKPDRLTFAPSAMYRRDGIGLPGAELVDPVPGPWDDTFLNTDAVVLHYDERSEASTVTVTSDCDHWVVYDQPTYATCVEPQSGPPDAPTMRPELVTPDAPLHRWMNISWT
jgi:aldose 1-epimerase